MCLTCWDTDERKTLVMGDGCDGKLSPFMTVEELKVRIVRKWHKTKKTDHLIYKDAIINPPDHALQWTETVNNRPVELNVRFVNF